MVRRRVAAGVGVVLLILIVLLINGCLKSQKQQSLKDYNRNVSQLAQQSDTQVARPLFTALSGAAGKSPPAKGRFGENQPSGSELKESSAIISTTWRSPFPWAYCAS